MTEQQCPDPAEPNPFLELVRTLETMSPEEIRATLTSFLDCEAGAEARKIGADVLARRPWTSEAHQAIPDALAAEIEALSTPSTIKSHGTVLLGAQTLIRGIARQIWDPEASAEAFGRVGQILEIVRNEMEAPR